MSSMRYIKNIEQKLAMLYKKNSGGYRQVGGEEENKIIAEKGEVYRDENGSIKQVNQNAPSHDDGLLVDNETNSIEEAAYNDGGIILNDAESVLSSTHENRNSSDMSYGVMDEAIKIKPTELDDYAMSLGLKKIKYKTSISPSKAFELLRDTRDKEAERLLKFKTSTFSDDYSKASAKANETTANMLVTDDDLYEYLFQIQELKKSRYA